MIQVAMDPQPVHWDPSVDPRKHWSDYYQEYALDVPTEGAFGEPHTTAYEGYLSPYGTVDVVFEDGIWYWVMDI